MSRAVRIDPQMSVEELLARHPAAATAFISHRMACPGCPIAPFETIEEAVRIYDGNARRFLESVRRCVAREAVENRPRRSNSENAP